MAHLSRCVLLVWCMSCTRAQTPIVHQTGDLPLLSDSGQIYMEFQVEQPARPIPISPMPKYPQELLDAHVEGEVTVRFVIDTTGRVLRGSLKILKSSHPGFTASVLETVPTMTFIPARIGKRKVRQIVVQPFQFYLKR